MPSSKQRRRKGYGEIVPPLSKLDRIAELLRIQVETFPQKELTPEEIARWEQDLSDYPLPAIEYAFDQHRRLAMFFPVPGQILDLCESYELKTEQEERCSRECKSRHGLGYGWVEMRKLWQLFGEAREKLGRPLDDLEFSSLLNVIDKQRGYTPAWRRP